MEGKQTGGSEPRAAAKTSFWRRRGVRKALIVVVIIGAFGFGVNVGNGSFGWSSKQGDELPATLDYTSLNTVYRTLVENYDGKLTKEQLINGLKHGMVAATNDPYTTYFTPEEAKSFNDGLQGQFEGIGAELGKNDAGSIQIIAPVAGMPAEKAGLKAQDVIASINDKTTAGMSVDSAVKAIRGKAGTTVKLQIVRDGDAFDVNITRQSIQIPSVTTKTLDGNIGYIRVSTFAQNTGDLVKKAAADFKAAGVKGIVLDLRSNPGGQVDSAVTVASQWLPAGQLIMQEKSGGKVVQSYSSTGDASLQDVPTVVLIDGGSASASEIVAAALHDNKHAYLIGEKSYGKGVVQQLINFKDGAQLKVTVASWYRPNGKNINHQGIQPDQKVTVSDEDAKAGNDTQLQAAQAYLAR